MQPGCGGKGGVGVAIEEVLADRHGRAEAADRIHLGRRQALGGAAQGIDIQEAPPRLVVEGIKHQRGLTGAGDAGDGG